MWKASLSSIQRRVVLETRPRNNKEPLFNSLINPAEGLFPPASLSSNKERSFQDLPVMSFIGEVDTQHDSMAITSSFPVNLLPDPQP